MPQDWSSSTMNTICICCENKHMYISKEIHLIFIGWVN